MWPTITKGLSQVSSKELQRAVSVTVAELKSFQFDKLHTAAQPKSLAWDLENDPIDATASPALHSKFRRYCKALEALSKPPRGRAMENSVLCAMETCRSHFSSRGESPLTCYWFSCAASSWKPNSCASALRFHCCTLGGLQRSLIAAGHVSGCTLPWCAGVARRHHFGHSLGSLRAQRR